MKISFLKKLGPEPLGKKFNRRYFLKFIKNKKKNIKNLLNGSIFCKWTWKYLCK